MENILVPTDFSKNAANAVEHAAVIAHACKASITLLHIHPTSGFRHRQIKTTPSEELPQIVIELNKKLGEIARDIRQRYPTLHCEIAVVLGDIVESIVASVRDNTDIIIMGTQGASSLEKILLGSNAAEIVEKAPCPVLVIPMNALYRIPKKIVYATDYAYGDIASARRLIAMAKLFDATVTFLHVSSPDGKGEDDALLLEKFTTEIKLATKYQRINAKILSENTVIMGLDTIIQNAEADMLAISTRRRNLFEKIFKPSIAKKMAKYTQIPLLAFKVAGD